MAQLLILTPAANDDVLPALSLLTHRVRVIPASPDQLVRAPEADLVFLDARTNLAGAKALAQILRTTGLSVPLILVVTEGGLTAVSSDWGVDDVILEQAGPAEIDARIRLVDAVGAVDQLRKLAAREEVIDGAGEGLRVDQLGGANDLLAVGPAEAVDHDAAHLEQALAHLLAQQLVHEPDAPVAQVVDVVEFALAGS